jgi:hypothetical protein
MQPVNTGQFARMLMAAPLPLCANADSSSRKPSRELSTSQSASEPFAPWQAAQQAPLAVKLAVGAATLAGLGTVVYRAILG